MSANKKLRIDNFRIAVIHQQWAARANRSQKGALTTLPERHIFPSTTLSWERMDRVPNHIPQEVTMTSPSDIENFKASLLGELLRPGDPGYDDARKIWNGMIDKRPALIVHCAGGADVIHCVNFAQANSLLVAVRGGGWGYLARKHGLSCDNLLSLDIVTADGWFHTASATENADLFWGLRGGGGNFGVVTSFEYQLHPVGPVFAGIVAYHIQK